MLTDGLSFVSGSDWNYDIAGSTLSTPSDSDVIMRFEAARAFTLPASLAGLSAGAGTNPSSNATFTVQKNGTDVTNATFEITTGGVLSNTASNTAESFAVGDVLTVTVTATNSVDDVSLTIKTLSP